MKLKFLAAFGALALASAFSAAPASAFTVNGLSNAAKPIVETVARHCVVRTVVTHEHGHRVVRKVRTCH
jgi:hypothetical protein